jgi:peptidyl-prolyl cis-trans isomerase D
VTPFDQVKEKLEKDLKAQLAPDLLIKLVTDFERVLSKTQSMATAAQDLQLKVKSVENVDARGQDMAGKDVALGPAGVAVLQAAFATRESSESELLETQNGEYFVVRTERITPARIPALTEVEAKVKEAWQNDERRKLADAKVKEAVDKANAGTDMATIAKDLGLELRTANAVTRFDADTGNYLTQPAAQELFKLPVGKVVSVRSAQGSVILRANEIIPVDLAKEKEPLDRFGKQLDITIGNDLIAQLLAGLRQKYGVSINEAAFTAAFQSQQPQQ